MPERRKRLTPALGSKPKPKGKLRHSPVLHSNPDGSFTANILVTATDANGTRRMASHIETDEDGDVFLVDYENERSAP